MIYENYMYFSNAQQTCAYTPKLDVFGKVYSGYTLVISNLKIELDKLKIKIYIRLCLKLLFINF